MINRITLYFQLFLSGMYSKSEFCSGANLIARPHSNRTDSPDDFTRPVRKSGSYVGVRNTLIILSK